MSSISFSFKGGQVPTNIARKAVPTPSSRDRLAAQAIEKMGGRAKFDELVANAIQKASTSVVSKPQVADKAAREDAFLLANPNYANYHMVVSKAASNVKPSPPGAISATIKAVMQNKLGVDSTDGRTIRNDRSTSPEFTDAATTHIRRPVAFDVQEAAGGLTTRKARRDPTAEEIRAETTFPARDADSVAAIMRANRKLR